MLGCVCERNKTGQVDCPLLAKPQQSTFKLTHTCTHPYREKEIQIVKGTSTMILIALMKGNCAMEHQVI